MNQGATIYIPGFIKMGSGIQKLMGGIHRHTDSVETAYAFFNFLKIGKVG
jgi:hypothetical protein